MSCSGHWHYPAKVTLSSHVGSPLSVLGFTPEQEDLYRSLLRNPDAHIDKVAEMLGRSTPELREELAALVATGLIGLDDDHVRVNPPDHAIGRLISEERRRLHSVHDQLESVRSLLPSLTADHLASQAPKGEHITIEAVEGGDLVGLVRSLSVSSTGDLLWLRPDQWQLDVGREIDDWVVDLVQSGRRSRAIYPARVLEEAPDVVRRRAEAGEHVRILASVPSRLAVMGTSAALLWEHWASSSGRRLVIRQHGMVGALTMLFDSLWDRAMAVPGLDGQGDSGERGSGRRLLLDQLARGAKDEQIARALGLSLRTVRRRVAEILDELGVDSRFQAGVEAVRRGWI